MLNALLVDSLTAVKKPPAIGNEPCRLPCAGLVPHCKIGNNPPEELSLRPSGNHNIRLLG